MNNYLLKINAFIASLHTETRDALERIITTREYNKGDYLLKEGSICQYSFIIENGIARKYYLKEEKEITTDLYFPDDIAVSFKSYTMQKPSRDIIQALEKCTVAITEYAAFENLKLIYPELVSLDLMMTEYYAMWLEERLFQFHSFNATQRYLLLLKEQPQLIQKVQLTFIASYLGISLETLSRIRARI